MESSRPSWSWKEGFRFALCWKLLSREGDRDLPHMNRIEIAGSRIVDPLYAVLDRIAKHLRKSHVILLFTLSLAIVLCIVFYEIPALIFFGKIFPAKVVRFSLFVYIEALLLGIGCKAFGRFHNRSLVQSWKTGKLTPTFPGKMDQ